MYFCFSFLLSVHVQMMSGHRVASACYSLQDLYVRGKQSNACPNSGVFSNANAAESIIQSLSGKNHNFNTAEPFCCEYFWLVKAEKYSIRKKITFKWDYFKYSLCMELSWALHGMEPLLKLLLHLSFSSVVKSTCLPWKGSIDRAASLRGCRTVVRASDPRTENIKLKGIRTYWEDTFIFASNKIYSVRMLLAPNCSCFTVHSSGK